MFHQLYLVISFSFLLKIFNSKFHTPSYPIAGLQPIPRDSNDKDAAAMLGVQTIEAN